ncbi:MAG: ribonuclease HI family protein [Candidatus Nanoarchaeia archaeon]
MITIHCDGASKKNPGESGVGIHITHNEKTLIQLHEYIGHATNNIAEYISVLRAIEELKKIQLFNQTIPLTLIMDSELVIKQLKGEYQIKQPQLKLLYTELTNQLKEHNIQITYNWVKRDNNSKADELANRAIENKTQTSEYIQSLLKQLENSATQQQNPNQTLTQNYSHAQSPSTHQENNTKNNNSNSSNNNDTKHTQNTNSYSSNNTFQPNQSLIAERVFFAKTTCLKFQISKTREVYIHIGAMQQQKWSWNITKFNDLELAQLLNVIEGVEDKCAFFHNNSHKGANTKTQIWCTKTDKGLSIKINALSKLLNHYETRVLKLLIERSIWEINKL